MRELADGALGVRDRRPVQVLVETSGGDAQKESNLLAFVRIVVLVHGASFYQALTWWRRPRDKCGTRTIRLSPLEPDGAPACSFSS